VLRHGNQHRWSTARRARALFCFGASTDRGSALAPLRARFAPRATGSTSLDPGGDGASMRVTPSQHLQDNATWALSGPAPDGEPTKSA
jgi:hypothetical protein